MRLEDFLFLEGWEWQGDIKKYQLKPGDEISIVSTRDKKGYFYGALAAFGGHDDAKYAYLLVNIDDTFYMPLYPYGLAVLGVDMWTPYGTMLLKYDTVADVYIVAEIPGYLIPIRNKLEIKIGYPKVVDTIFGKHVNTATITAYALYLYILIIDEELFKKSYKELMT